MHRPNRTSIALLALGLLLLPAIGVADASPTIEKFISKGFPDNADLRGKLFSYVIGATKDVAVNYGEKRLQSSAGMVTVRVDKRSTDFVVQFLNPNASDPSQPGRGSCFVQRSNAKGNYILQARILLEDDPSCYISFYPSGSGSRADVVMYGAVVKKGLFFSDMIYRILLLSFADIVDSTSRSFDWGLVFRFGGKGSDYVAELRSAAPALAEQSAAPAAPLSSPQARIALAAAPGLPAFGAQADPSDKGPRPARIAAAIDKASSAEALILELGASGETASREIALAPDAAAAFTDDKGEVGKIVYSDFPRYDGRGIALSALRAALYLDLLANPDSAYAIMGEGLRATVVPAFDDAGRLVFSVFSEGKETSWDDFAADRRDLKVRAVRIQA